MALTNRQTHGIIAERDQARAEVKRLRESLLTIAEMRAVPGYTSRSALLLRIAAINSTARAALYP